MEKQAMNKKFININTGEGGLTLPSKTDMLNTFNASRKTQTPHHNLDRSVFKSRRLTN